MLPTSCRTLPRPALVAALVLVACKPPQSPAALEPQPEAVDLRPAPVEPTEPVEHDLYAEAREVFEARCVHCHGCYDAPCQLKLDEPGGVHRGGSKVPVYDGSRLTAETPTRYGIDAQSVDQWRDLGFHPVLETDATGAALPGSTLLRLLELKREHPLPQGKLLPDDMPVGLEREAVCAAPDALDDFVSDHPTWGMPYGLPALSEAEHAALTAWLADGSPIPPPPPLPDAVRTQVANWEAFLNQESPKAQLMARYLYEHLFVATLQIRGPSDQTVRFRLVRSTTPPGEPIEEMATRRPFDPPLGETLYYRLRRKLGTRLSKTHMPYALNAARMARWRELFLDAEYEVEALPGYESEQAANPFATYAAIPVRSRYAFMIDEAEFTLMGFIKGPVCRGQVALDVIQDHFWVAFVRPDSPLHDHEDGFLREHAELLRLPAADGSNAWPTRWFKYARNQRKYQKAKGRFLGRLSKTIAPDLDLVWDGDGSNPNAGLTVFRHFDSATVTRGLLGPRPKTAWLLSYGLLERIHYLLVAGFDVFGNVGHQLTTRLYMDFLRMEAEQNLLLLLPREVRRPLVDRWYQGVGRRAKDAVYGGVEEFAFETAIDYQTDAPYDEFLSMLQDRLAGALAGQRPGLSELNDPTLREPLTALASAQGMAASLLPEQAFLRVRGTATGDAYFTLLRTSAHTNVAHLFREDKRRKPEQDSLVVLPGFLGAYPNTLFEAEAAQLPELAARASALDGPEAYEAFVDQFGVRRTDPAFWERSDALREARQSLDSSEAGLLDYNRLENR